MKETDNSADINNDQHLLGLSVVDLSALTVYALSAGHGERLFDLFASMDRMNPELPLEVLGFWADTSYFVQHIPKAEELYRAVFNDERFSRSEDLLRSRANYALVKLAFNDQHGARCLLAGVLRETKAMPQAAAVRLLALLSAALISVRCGRVGQAKSSLRWAEPCLATVTDLPAHLVWQFRESVAVLAAQGGMRESLKPFRSWIKTLPRIETSRPRAAQILDTLEPAHVSSLFREQECVKRLDVTSRLFGRSHRETLAAFKEALEAFAPGAPPRRRGEVNGLLRTFHRLRSKYVHPLLEHSTEALDRCFLFLLSGDRSRATQELARLCHVENTQLRRVLPRVTERTRLGLVAAYSQTLGLLLYILSECTDDPALVSSVYEVFLNRRGQLTEVEQALRADFAVEVDEDLVQTRNEYLKLRRQVALASFQALEGPAGPRLYEWAARTQDDLSRDAPALKPDLTSHVSKIALYLTLRANQQTDSQRLQELEEQVLAARRAVASRTPTNEAVSVDDLGVALKDDDRLIEFVKVIVPADSQLSGYEDRYFRFAISRGATKAEVHNLGPARVIDELVRAHRASITGSNEEIVSPSAKEENVRPDADVVQGADWARGASPAVQLFDVCMSDLELAATGPQRLFVVPDGELLRLPFETLITHPGDRLIDRASIVYLASARDLVASPAPPSSGEPVVIADPSFDLDEDDFHEAATSGGLLELRGGKLQFRRLKGARKEADEVAQLLRARPLFGRDATVKQFEKIISPSVLHIATHGFFLPNVDTTAARDDGLAVDPLAGNEGWIRGVGLENPLYRSGLALSGVNDYLRGEAPPEECYPGFVTAADVASLNLQGTELVVLSACETGLGDIQNNEGVRGLRYAVSAAGAQSVVMSLWRVADETARQLMSLFYANLAKGHGRSDALRGAQLELRETNPHPRHWGAFILQGLSTPVRALCEGVAPAQASNSASAYSLRKGVVSGARRGTLKHVRKLCIEGLMQFTLPDGFVKGDQTALGTFEVDYHIRSQTTDLEIFVAVRPMSALMRPFTEQAFLDAVSTVGEVRGGGEFGRDAVNQEFGADWGVFTPVAGPLGKTFNSIAVYREGAGVGFVFFLLSGVEDATEMLNVFHLLRFVTAH